MLLEEWLTFGIDCMSKSRIWTVVANAYANVHENGIDSS